MPAIEASSLEDLFFAQGFITAQDRLWQMDVMRRFGAGELSEILGKGTVKIDREQRILGLRAAAKKSLAMATPRDRSYFDAYARGVNAFIESHGNALPIEFRILKYRPKPWQAEDSIVIANQMVKDLNYYTFQDALSAREDSGQAGTGVDGRSLREPVVARPPSDRHARRHQRSAEPGRLRRR